MESIDLEERLLEEATQMGIVTPEQTIAHLESFILSTSNYLEYRKRRGRFTSHNQMAYLHMLAAARAIDLLQPLVRERVRKSP